MKRPTAPLRNPHRRECGMSILELLVVMGIIAILASILIPAYLQALHTSQSRALLAEARTMMTALLEYYHDESQYPPTLDASTFEPLRSLNYYRGNVAERLLDGAVDVYESPSDEGPNQEFYVEMTLRDDPSFRVLVADSDDAPLSGGEHIQGIVLFRNGVPLSL